MARITGAFVAVWPRFWLWPSLRSSHPLTFRVRGPHIADEGVATLIYVYVLNADKLTSASTQASQRNY